MMRELQRGFDGGASRLSPLARPFNLDFSSSLPYPSSNVFSPADPCLSDDSIVADFAFDLSFLSSDDHNSGLDDSLSNFSSEGGAATLPVEGSRLYGQAACASETKAGSGTTLALSAKDQGMDLEIMRENNVESVPKLSSLPESDMRSAESHTNSRPQVSLAIPAIHVNHFDSEVTLGEGCCTHFSPTSVLGEKDKIPAANNVSTDNVYSDDGDAEGQPPSSKDNAACLGKLTVNQTGQKINNGWIDKSSSSSFFSGMSELQIRCPSGTNNGKLDLHSANATVLPEKSSVQSDQDDSEVDSPCWRGTQYLNTAATTSKSMTPRHSCDDLNGFYRLNPLAPHFIPANAKRSLDAHVKDCEENSSLSLQKPLSSAFPLTYEDYSLTEPFKAVRVPPNIGDTIKNYTCGETSKASGASILPQDVDRSSNFVSQDGLSKVESRRNSSNKCQTSKRLDPSAPKFVPAIAKPSAVVLEKQGGGCDMVACETNAPSSSALSSTGNGLLDSVEAETHSAEVRSGFWDQCSDGVHEEGSSYSLNPWLVSKAGIPENVNLETSSNELCGQHRLNPLAPEFLLAGTSHNLNCLENNLTVDNSLPVVNTAVSSTSFVVGKDKLIDASELRSQPSVPMTQQQSNRGSSLLISSVVDQPARVEDHFALSKQLMVGPKPTTPSKGSKDIARHPSCHTSEYAAGSLSSESEALSGSSQNHSYSSITPSSKMDVKRLLATMHGLSELLTLVQGHSYGSDTLNEQEFVLVDDIVKNLNLYMRNRGQKHARNDPSHIPGSYNSKQLDNPHKLLIGDFQPSRPNDRTVNIDHKNKEKCPMVSGEMLPDFSRNGGIRGNGKTEVIPNNALWGNHQLGEQINSQELLYRSLWHKAEAELCLMKYEGCLSRMKT